MARPRALRAASAGLLRAAFGAAALIAGASSWWCAHGASFVGPPSSLSRRGCAARGSAARGLTRLSALRPGQQLRGTVTGFNKAGALLDVGLDLPAFLHVSKIQEDFLDSAKDVLAEGQQIDVIVERKKAVEIEVTMLPPREGLAIGQELTGTVTGFTKVGALLDVGLDLPAFLHVSKIQEDWLASAEDVLSEGQQIDVIVERQEPREIEVTMLRPLEDLVIGQELTGTVTGFNKAGALLDVGLDVPAFLHVSKIQEDRLASAEDVLSEGQKVEVRVERGDRKGIEVTMLPSDL